MSPVLFIILKDRTSRCSQAVEVVKFGGLRIKSLFVAAAWRTDISASLRMSGCILGGVDGSSLGGECLGVSWVE